MADENTEIQEQTQETTPQQQSIQFEDILPWGTTGGDTGLSSRLKLKRNFDKIKAWMTTYRDEKKVDVDWFSKLFVVHGTKTVISEPEEEGGEPVTTVEEVTIAPNEWPVSTAEVTYTVTDIELKYGAWTKYFLSALGKNADGSGGALMLFDLLDVRIPESPTVENDGQALVYDFTLGKWTNKTVGGGGATLNEPLASINSALLGAPSQAGIGIVWNGTAWVYRATNAGSVTSVGLTAPTGFVVNGTPITSSGTLGLAFADGYSLPTTAKQGQWDSAYSAMHSHTNKAVLDGITSTKVGNWDTAFGWGNHAAVGYALASSVYSKTDADTKFMTIEAFENLFKALASDGSTKVNHPYASGVASIKALFGVWTEQYLSALGLSDSGSSAVSLLSDLLDVELSSPSDNQVLTYYNGKWRNRASQGGTDMASVWAALAANGSEQINVSHLSTALSGYATQQWVQQQGYVTSSGITSVTKGEAVSGGAVTTVDGAVTIQFPTKPSYSFSEITGKATASQVPNIEELTNYAAKVYDASLSRPANTVLAAPNGSSGAATFRALVAADIPNLDAGKITSGTFAAARIPDLSGTYVTLTTTQTISGTKTFTPLQTFTNGIKIGSYEIVPDAQNGGLHIKGGVYADTYISALGLSDSGSGSSFDWSYLTTYDGDPTHKIDLRYLDLSAYALKTDIPTLKNLSWSYGSVTSASGDSYNGATAKSLVIPKNTSHLTNDSGFVTSSALGNYLPLTGGNITGFLSIVGTSHQNFAISSSAETSGVKWTGMQFQHVTGSTATMYGGIRMDEQNGSLIRYDSTYNTYKIWDAENDGVGSGLDADLLDGTHKADLFGSLTNSGKNISITIGGTNKTLEVGYAGYTNILRSYVMADTDDYDTLSSYTDSRGSFVAVNLSTITTIPSINDYDTLVSYGYNYRTFQLKSRAYYNQLSYRTVINEPVDGVDNIHFGNWKDIAFTDSNVASASKLNTTQAYTVWGQTYWNNGVPQSISNTYMSGVTNIDSLLYFDTTNGRIGIGKSNPSYALDVVGTAKATTIRATDIYIGGIHITADNNGVHINSAGLYADTYVSALGLSDSGGSGGIDWDALAANTNEQINVSHLTTALAPYALTSQIPTSLKNPYKLTITLNGVATEYDGSAARSLTINTGLDQQALATYLSSKILTVKNGTDSLGTWNPTTAGTIDIASALVAYLPLTGGTLSLPGIGYLTIKNTASDYPLIRFEGKTAGGLGFIGVNAQKQPVFVTVDTNGGYTDGVSQWYTLLHTGNWTSTINLTSLGAASSSSVSTLQGYFANGVANSAARLSGTSSYTAWGQTYWTSGVPQSILGDIRMLPSGGNTNSDSAKIDFRTLAGNDDYVYAPYIQAINVNDYGRKRLSVFQKSQSDWTTAQTEVFTIWPTGTVGINTSLPNTNYKLDVNGYTKTYRLYLSDTIYMEVANNGVHIVGGGLYADTYVSALGLSDGGSGSVSALADLVDVSISSPSNGQALVYRNGLWRNENVQSSGGSVTSVGLTVPTGFSVGGSPVTTSGTLSISFANGYSLPTTAKQSNWDTAYGWGNHATAGYATPSSVATQMQTYANIQNNTIHIGDNSLTPLLADNVNTLFTSLSSTNDTNLSITVGGTTKTVSGLYALRMKSVHIADATSGNAYGNLDNLDGSSYSVVTNYFSNSYWSNAPAFNDNYGGAIVVRGKYDYLMGQLAWSAAHGTTDYPTKDLWWRARASGGWKSDWKRFAFRGESQYIDNNNYIYWKNNASSPIDILTIGLTSNNDLVIGYGVAGMGYNTYLDGNNVYIRYGASRTSGIVLNSSGNVGIGTTSPSYKLDVAGDMGCSGALFKLQGLELNSTGALSNFGGYIDFHYNGGGSDYTSRIIEDASGRIYLNASAGVRIGNVVLIYDSTNNALKVQHYQGGAANFYALGGVSALGMSAGTSGMINANLLPETTNAYTLGDSSHRFSYLYANNVNTNNLSVGGQLSLSYATSSGGGTSTIYAGSSANGFIIKGDASTTLQAGSSLLLQAYASSTAKSTITLTTSAITANRQITVNSDMRLKDVYGAVEAELEDIARTPIFNFKWRDLGDADTIHLGTAADYIQGLFPSAVTRTKDGILALDYSATALAAAVITARTVMTHEERIAALEAENERLRNEIETLKAA